MNKKSWFNCSVCLLLYLLVFFNTSSAEEESIQKVAPDKIEVIKIDELQKKNLSHLWESFKFAKSSQLRKTIVAIISGRIDVEIPVAIDSDICNEFAVSPTPDLALLLGMCKSSGSEELLKQNQDSEDEKLANACNLGLARKGNKDAALVYINLYNNLAKQSQNQLQLKNKIELIRKLEYIGSVETITTLFDDMESRLPSKYNSYGIRDDGPVIMHECLSEVDSQVAKKMTVEEMLVWWKRNRNRAVVLIEEKIKVKRLRTSKIYIMQY